MLEYGSLPTVHGRVLHLRHGKPTLVGDNRPKMQFPISQLRRARALDPFPRVELQLKGSVRPRIILTDVDDPRDLAACEEAARQVAELFEKLSYLALRGEWDGVVDRGWTSAPRIEKQPVPRWPVDAQKQGGYRGASRARVLARSGASLLGRVAAWLRSGEERAFVPSRDDPRWSFVLDAALTATTLTFRERGPELYQLSLDDLSGYCEPDGAPPLFAFGRTYLSFVDPDSDVAQKLRAQLES